MTKIKILTIIYLTRQLERWLHPIRSGKIYNSVTKVVANLEQRQGGYFLFFIFRMDMINPAVAMITINSSYVLIITTPSVRPPERVEAALPVAWVNILFCEAPDYSGLFYYLGFVFIPGKNILAPILQPQVGHLWL